jgi:hypothetical protein
MITRILWLGLLTVAGVAVATRLLVAVGLPSGRVTSWWRLPWHNQEVGGLGWSSHLLGWAVDVAPPTIAGDRWLRSVFPVVVNEGDHLHASWMRTWVS